MRIVVVTPASNFRLTTIDHCRADIGIGADVSDATLGRMIDAASSRIATYCRRTFARETLREIVDGGADRLLLSRGPVVSVASVMAGSAIILSNVDLDLSGDALCRASGRWWPFGGWAVEYVAGYALPGEPGDNLPAEIEQAAMNEIAAMLAAKGRDPTVTAESISGVGSYSYGTAAAVRGGQPFVHPGTLALVEPYRVPVLA